MPSPEVIYDVISQSIREGGGQAVAQGDGIVVRYGNITGPGSSIIIGIGKRILIYCQDIKNHVSTGEGSPSRVI